jgi:sialate O-acetylesterase
MKSILRSCVLLATCALSARADIGLPAIFSDHMVLQRDVRVPVWGTADAGTTVTVEFAGQKKSAKADTSGRWRVDLDPLAASAAPRDFLVTGTGSTKNENQKISDVIVGEVWLGSGQSNMALTVNRAKDFPAERAAGDFPLIRHFKEESANAVSPQSVSKGRWVLCTPDSVGTFSAALYFFGRELHQTLGVPVGLINSSVGGTPIEAWIDADAQKGSKEIQAALAALPPALSPATPAVTPAPNPAATDKQKNTKKTAKATKAAAPRSTTGGLFNGKIAPLIPYAIRGALWYQGEANTVPAKAPLYEHQFALLVRDWRMRWGHEFPFAWVQLPNFMAAGRDWPTVREAMLKTLALPKTGMAITIDVGEINDIHPKDKQTVGHRLAQWALGAVYAQKVAATSGPLPAGHEIRGGDMILRFQHADGGLVAKNGPLTGFIVAGSVANGLPPKHGLWVTPSLSPRPTSPLLSPPATPGKTSQPAISTTAPVSRPRRFALTTGNNSRCGRAFTWGSTSSTFRLSPR